MLPDADQQQIKHIQHCLDSLLQKPPAEAHADLYLVERELVKLRNSFITTLRQTESAPSLAQALTQTNAILSLVVGCEYPGGAVQWDLLEQAQTALAKLSPQTN